MLLNTIPFLAFFIVLCTVYWKISPKHQWILLLLAGYYFLGFWQPAYVGLIILTTIINYVAGIKMYKSGHKLIFLSIALSFDLLVLFIFKYFNFFALTLNNFIPNLQIPRFKFLLPLGISFYTFQTISYLLDVYRGTIKPERHLGYFGLFVSFFPTLSAGPIERAGELIPQLKIKHLFDYGKTVSGIELFTIGLFKKMVIADNLAVIVDRVFANLEQYKGLSLVIAVIVFSWQIYADFSGYTDMARGIAKILGFNLVDNFNFPYFSTSLRDFWRRWHMSLSRWFREYVYIPMGGNKQGLIRTCINSIIVFTLCGLWHGAGWMFLLWGLYHGVVMSFERIGTYLFRGKFKIPRFLAVLYTYAVVCISWVFFRAQTFADAMYIFRYWLVGWKNFVSPAFITATLNQLFKLNRLEIIITALLLFTIVILELVTNVIPRGQLLHRQPRAVRYAIYIVIVFAIVHLRNSEIKQFIYTRF